jgi:hypothetical protein
MSSVRQSALAFPGVKLFTRAMREYLGACRDSTITASYDEAFATDDDELAAFRREATRKALLGVEWTEK